MRHPQRPASGQGGIAPVADGDVAQSYLSALRDGDRRRALTLVEQCAADDWTIQDLYLTVFQPALREIGRLWQLNQLTVAEEHLATAITEAAMARLYVTSELPAQNGRTIIAGCAERERHSLGLRMLCDLLDLAGWETLNLGAGVPASSFAEMVAERAPEAVALSVAIAPHLTQLGETINSVREATQRPLVVIVGGRPFLDRPELSTKVGADLCAPDAAAAVALLEGCFA